MPERHLLAVTAALTLAAASSVGLAQPVPPRAGTGGAATPPAGRYVCLGSGLNAGGGRGFVYKGAFTLLERGRYSANNTSGTTSVTGTRLRFAGGAYDGIEGEVGTGSAGKPQVVLTWPGAAGGRASTQYCNLAA